ncbi:MAG: hypothetical protein ACD_37C00098G0002 [uncultured bacterium]|nr:MAG: hypothetical protein ACD_37C00098G0002 [uncultured bacterium]
MSWLKQNKKNLIFIAFLFILLLPSVFSILIPGYFESDDGEWMVIRFSAFYQALSDGQFPVRFLGRLNFGYGYPVANFLYPGFMYLATPLQVLGFGFVNSVKVIMLASFLGGGFFTYLWLSKIFDRTSALVGATVYTYAPYHLFDLYKRGSVGEVLSMGVLPFILWQIERNSIFWTATGIFLLILSHNTLAVLFLLFISGYISFNVYISKTRKQLISRYILVVLLGLGMASFFWIPAFYDLKYTVFSNTQISDWTNYFADIDLIGLPTLAVFALIVILIISKKIKIKKHRLTILFLAVGLFSVFLSTSASTLLWNFIPSSFVQFPFRFLSLLVPSVAFLAACAVSVINGKNKIILAIALFILVFVSSFSFLNPEVKSNKTESFYSTNEATTTVRDEYMPEWVKEKPNYRFGKKVEILIGGEVSNLSYNSERIYFETSGDTDKMARINTIYYPGWQAEVNNNKVQISYDNPQGVMEINLPKGENKVELVFKETPVRLFANILSLVSFILLIVICRKSVINIFKK